MEGSGARVAVLGDTIKHFPAGQLSAFDISAANVSKEDIQVHIVSECIVISFTSSIFFLNLDVTYMRFWAD